MKHSLYHRGSGILLALLPTWALGQPYTKLCADLAVGDSVSVYIPGKRSPTTVTHSYSLKRQSTYHYEAYLNLRFHDCAELGLSSEALKKFYLERGQACVDKYQDTFADGSGRTLGIIFYDERLHGTAAIPKPMLVDIAIREKGHRSDSRNYEHKTDCKTLIHEFLHLLGLADEYEERVRTGLFKSENLYPGRAVSTDASWMAHFSLGILNSGIGKTKKRLFKGQLDAIVYPGCETRNSTYYSCVKSAYDFKAPPTIPPICKTKTKWLDSP